MRKAPFALTLVALVGLTALVSGCLETSAGTHVGYVTAVEKNGLIWKTGNAYFKTNTQSTQEDKYCVESEEVFNALRDFGASGARVEITFHDEAVIAFWRGEGCTNGIIDSVRAV